MPLAQQAVAELSAVHEYFNRSTRNLTETHSKVTPAPGMMTVAQQVAHAAHKIDWFMEGAFRPEGFDLALYQIGNNPYHDFVYEAALRHPGVAVMHESNVHHLIADITIKRCDWQGYLKEAAYNGGSAALEYAQKVKALQTAPDYEGIPMTRRRSNRSSARHGRRCSSAAA